MDANEAKIYSAVLIASLFLSSIVIFFIISIVRQQRRNLELHRQNILTEINTLEKERTRIAADLHDELGPTLSAIRFQVESVEVDDEEEQEILQKAGKQIDETIGRVREIASNVMPSALIRKGLINGLVDFISKFSHPTLQIEFQHDVKDDLSQENSINIYRIIQEIIQNTAKHAHASKLLIKIEQKKNLLHIICEDNGLGFNYNNIIKQPSGLGLRNLKSRVEIMKGKMDVYSVKEKGTQFNFIIPMQ
ncbi:MAG: sensor histidine kinase [Chitinophagaceae bacterium]